MSANKMRPLEEAYGLMLEAKGVAEVLEQVLADVNNNDLPGVHSTACAIQTLIDKAAVIVRDVEDSR